MQSGGNPQAILQQLGQANPQQMQKIIQNARNMGCPDNILAQVQNFRNTNTNTEANKNVENKTSGDTK